MLSDVLGAGVGTPGPPVILWTAAQQWEPRTMNANLQAFFVLNQAGGTSEILRVVIGSALDWGRGQRLS